MEHVPFRPGILKPRDSFSISIHTGNSVPRHGLLFTVWHFPYLLSKFRFSNRALSFLPATPRCSWPLSSGGFVAACVVQFECTTINVWIGLRSYCNSLSRSTLTRGTNCGLLLAGLILIRVLLSCSVLSRWQSHACSSYRDVRRVSRVS